MLRFTLVLAASLVLSSCAARPLPLQAGGPALLRQPVPQALPQGFRTSMSGLLGEEVELSGIYSTGPGGALLLLRSGEQLSLADPAGRPLLQLPGFEDRSSVRLRGRLRELGTGRLGLELRLAIRL